MSYNSGGVAGHAPRDVDMFQTPVNQGYGDAQYISTTASGSDPLAAAALIIANFVNKTLIAHPMMVLRHQCQVHQGARKLHLTPVTMVPVVIHMLSKDGIQTLWKGSLGCAVLSGVSYVTEIIIGDVFGLPRTIIYKGNSEKYRKHLTLKAVTFFTMTPFLISSFIETVRSGSGIGLDSNVTDIIFRGIDRLRFDLFGGKDAGKRFPVLFLTVPTTSFYLMHYLVSRWAYAYIYSKARRYVLKKPPQDRTRFHTILPELFAAMASGLTADVICYPFETILHRLYIQGTRTLIDNLDNGVSAISITAKYTGVFDCFKSVIKNEGFIALYAGVGAVALQYCLQFCVFRTVRVLFDYATTPTNKAHPQVNVGHQTRNSGPPSAQFAAVATPTTSTNNFVGESSPKRSFPTFAQTSANMDVPLGPLNSNFQETSNMMGGSSSPPIYHSPVRTNDLLLPMAPSPTTDY